MVVKGVSGHSVVELLDVVRTLGAEVVDLVVVLKITHISISANFVQEYLS